MANGTGGGSFDQKVIQLPGMPEGVIGMAGVDKPGPSIRAVAVPAWRYIAVEILWHYLQVFLGLLAVDGMGLVELAPPGDAFEHLGKVAGISLAPSALALLHELYQYLGKVRASQR